MCSFGVVSLCQVPARPKRRHRHVTKPLRHSCWPAPHLPREAARAFAVHSYWHARSNRSLHLVCIWYVYLFTSSFCSCHSNALFRPVLCFNISTRLCRLDPDGSAREQLPDSGGLRDGHVAQHESGDVHVEHALRVLHPLQGQAAVHRRHEQSASRFISFVRTCSFIHSFTVSYIFSLTHARIYIYIYIYTVTKI